MDNTVSQQRIGAGDGSTTHFQLLRTVGKTGVYSGFTEPCENVVHETVAVMLDGALVPASQYTLGSTSVITFSAPPAIGQVVSWSGQFYYRCRFTEDTAEFSQAANGMYDLKSIAFIGATGNKV